ncbi:MFS general substrate transporter [Auriscalpium vulgare]|uniref:MFS general substrate transporter n=1 Tax=Auriscalpium vulgare TaxID=40419 RepID=A0ACB8RTP4_9AGAM|nr:MFS general substrate transporter [Auriscalpium vulgare]
MPKRGLDFWLVFVANVTVDMLSALDLTAVSTALPTIVRHLHGTDFIWAGSAYTVASTAILPLVGGLVSVFGRKPVLLTFISIFAVGSAITGAAQNMLMFIAGRALQGMGGGGCLSVTEIIYADIIPLPEQGKFQGIIASVWALACAIGPPVGGALANSGAWRWLFFLNLPISAIAAGLVIAFLRVNAPKMTWREKITRIDWITISLMIALIWGGDRFPWRSASVLEPLVLGSVGIVTFFVVEALWIKEPTVPRFAYQPDDTERAHSSTASSPWRQSSNPAITTVMPKRGLDFWLVFVANVTVDMLSALDLTAVSTALPTIVRHLHGTDFIWAGSAYTVASTAILPLVGGLVSVFDRKPVLLTFISIFAVGSAITGAAQNMLMFIAGRALQGMGGGGCLSVTEIIYADIIPLPEQGKFQGIIASVWALACAIGPPVGGALANSGAWRWLFFLNLPISAIAAGLVIAFLRVNAPKMTWREKITRIDWITISLMIALIWGGDRFPWRSASVLEPLVLGSVGIVTFFVVEALWIKEPTVWQSIHHIMRSLTSGFRFRGLPTNRTTLSGYLGTFFHGIVSLAAIYYLPVYFQACKGAAPVDSSVDMLSLAFTVPAFATCVDSRPLNYIGWMLIVAGFGMPSLLTENSTRAQYIGYQVVLAAGLGIVWISTQFPILAPLSFSNNAHALAFFTFVRCFARQAWQAPVARSFWSHSDCDLALV